MSMERESGERSEPGCPLINRLHLSRADPVRTTLSKDRGVLCHRSQNAVPTHAPPRLCTSSSTDTRLPRTPAWRGLAVIILIY